jgi:hypothetical protein
VLVDHSSRPPTEEEERNEVELCTYAPKLDEHKSSLMKDNFNGVDREDGAEEELDEKRGHGRRVSREVRN